jgi:ATP-binding protein involved in chromosome partitioning
MSVTVEQVTQALSQLIDPNTGKDYVSGKSMKNLRVDGSDVSVDIELGYPAKSQLEPIRRSVIAGLRAVSGVANVSANVYQKIVSHAVQRGVKTLPGVKNIIAIASGKGGVGKSTTAVNLALALAAEGATVGMLDADIYGPSQPMMLGITGKPESLDGKTLEPMMGHGIQASSIGFMIDVDTPMVWRGPMVTQALEQLLRETNWRDLDYLIVDMPPGTGDIHLTLSQKIPVTGAVIVTTPQDIALLDARKGLKMFEKVGIPSKTWRYISAQSAVTRSIFLVKAVVNACPKILMWTTSAGCRSTSAFASRLTQASLRWLRIPMARSRQPTSILPAKLRFAFRIWRRI